MRSWQWLVTGVIALGVAGAPGATARAGAWKVTEESKVTFLATITGGSFEAASTALSGEVAYDRATGKLEGGQVLLKADSFDSGLGMRDRHIRDKYLEAKKHPAITFRLKPAGAPVVPGKTAQVAGAFTIKGKTRDVTVPVAVQNAGAALVVKATFPIDVTEYGIPQPRYAVVKMEKIIQVTLQLSLQPG